MSVQEQYADLTTGALGALERSAELWKQGATKVTDQVGVVSKMPLPDLDQAVDRYFEYLQRGIEVNRDFAKKWTDAVTAVSELAQTQTTALSDAVRGHADAITDWISGEADTAQKSAKCTGGRDQHGEAGAGPRPVRGFVQGRVDRPARAAGPSPQRHERRADRPPGRGRHPVTLWRNAPPAGQPAGGVGHGRRSSTGIRWVRTSCATSSTNWSVA